MSRQKWTEWVLRAGGALFAVYQVSKVVQTLQVMDMFEITPDQTLWSASMLHIISAGCMAICGVLIAFRVRYAVWGLVAVNLVTIVIGQVTQWDVGIVDAALLVSILILLYSLAFSRAYAIPWRTE